MGDGTYDGPHSDERAQFVIAGQTRGGVERQRLPFTGFEDLDAERGIPDRDGGAGGDAPLSRRFPPV